MFGEVLRRLRPRGVTQADLAAMIGANHSTISRLEHGNRRPSRNMVETIAAALQLDEHARSQLFAAAGFVDDGAEIDLNLVRPASLVNVDDPFVIRFLQLINDDRVPDKLVTPMLDRIDEFLDAAELVIGRPA